MRVALISDMHGNAVALDAVVAELEREAVDEVVSLGDVAQGGAQPAECLQRLRELRCRLVMGNSDEFLLDHAPELDLVPAERRESVLAVREWTRERLAPDDLDFLASFEPTVELALDGGRTLLCFHGSPRSCDDIVLPTTPEDELETMLGGRRASVMAGGHIHVQWLRPHGDCLFLCAGSVGMAYERSWPRDPTSFAPWAEYAVVTSAGTAIGVELRRVAFDVAALEAAIRESGKPDAAEELALRRRA